MGFVRKIYEVDSTRMKIKL